MAMATGLYHTSFMRYIWSLFSRTAILGASRWRRKHEGAIQVANNPVTYPNLNHIDVRHHFIRERVAKRVFKVVHVPSAEQYADFLTKIVARASVSFSTQVYDKTYGDLTYGGM